MSMSKQYCMHGEIRSNRREIKTAIITGSTGAIGNALCRLLSQNGLKVYAFVRPGSKRNDPLRGIPGVELTDCDIAHLKEFSRCSKTVRADAFFHLAWVKTAGAGRNDLYAQTDNIKYTLDACHLAADSGCKVFVGAGSQAEYGRVDHALTPDTPCFPENGYGMAKLCAGQMSRIECEKMGIVHIWPRILSVYGPYDGENTMISQTIRMLLDGKIPSLTAGEQIWDYLYADDAADALYRLALCGKNGGVYPVGSGIAWPLREYAKLLRDCINPALSLGFGEIPYGDKQVMHLEADITALKADTLFEPKTDLRTGIRRTIDYIRSVQSNG